ncbi:PilZ domain-containing protein [Vibrio hannami]|uniref:PilZ domain-containing protein n=1 Tax=Vibrio hannami TaxID=2717094 RepID=UPI00240E9CB0|nr:PilZ domain-containing protein [Vibrio hannami]MDG3085220.1 PilZ domain-containing protein [Vibrio hannami]
MELTVNQTDKIKDYLEFGMKLAAVIKFGPKDDYSFQCNLVGLKEGQFLILDLPAKTVEDLITRKTNNARIVIRGVTDTELGDIIAFKTEIITVTSRPTWLMYLKLPYSFESKPIRSNKRIKVNLPITIDHADEEHKATLRDLSMSGCGIVVKKSIDIAKDEEININTYFEHYPEESPKCIVANFRKYANQTFLGIKFDPELKMSDSLKYEIIDKAIFGS